MADNLLLDIMELRDESVASRDTVNSIDLASYEMQEIYQEREPFTTSRQITGIEYYFNEIFMDKVRYAMSTDNLDIMNNYEYEVWNYFVQYEDEFSTKYDSTLYPDAIGCTNPDLNGDSFVITNNGATTNLCTIEESDLEAIDVAKALDKALMKIINCEDYLLPTTIFDLENVSESCNL